MSKCKNAEKSKYNTPVQDKKLNIFILFQEFTSIYNVNNTNNKFKIQKMLSDLINLD